VTRQTLGGRVTRERWSCGGGVVNAEQPTARKGQPEPTRMVCVQVVNRARRQPILRGEERERAVAVTGQSSIESDPDVARAVFGERAGDIVFHRGKVCRPGQLAQSLIARLPENESVATGIEGRTPYSAFRVFKNAEDLRRGVCAFCS